MKSDDTDAKAGSCDHLLMPEDHIGPDINPKTG